MNIVSEWHRNKRTGDRKGVKMVHEAPQTGRKREGKEKVVNESYGHKGNE